MAETSVPASHSPLPWRVSDSVDEGGMIEISDDGEVTSLAEVAPYNEAVTAGHADAEAIAIGRANAAFIVRAVNAHDALKTSLAELLDWFVGGDDYADVTLAERCAKARAALALAARPD